MRTQVNLLFYLKKRATYKSGPVAIYLRFTVEGQRAEVSTGKTCDPSRWNVQAGRANGTKEDVRVLNMYLDTLQAKAQELHNLMTINEDEVTAETLKNRFIGKVEKARTLVTVFEDHNAKMESLLGQEFERSTLQRYKTCLMHTKDFMQWQYNVSDIPVKKISFSFLNDFEYYLRSVRKCGNNSAIKYIKNLGKIVRICLGNGWLTVDPYLNYKPKQKAVHREVLTKEELERIYKKKFGVERLNTVRDIFVFCCYTGLAYVDVHKLKREELVKGIDGNLWIYTHRQKTDTLSRVPVLPVALAIIRSYDKHPQCIAEDTLLPVMTNQKMNAYLKEIAYIAKVKKLLTFHIARHTFATTVTLNNGVPIESVAKMMGHTSIKTTQIYAKVMDHKISSDMQQLQSKLTVKKRTAKAATA
ncbi:site-specific integrase [Mucilaginibacter sp. L3T2-6]|uniref:site-specific integrase n=1 Tax=Mucilaginibacter sp. L3T2-6 TaxID=3062491 RepID=UPI002676CFBE|nr:site-specific integrase [Mucilaginibacter sp. L3T2-6]MDO3643153.1 site-specific integrase [Mucilaginibacter sp. L3T2-6]MDV6215477.1 site-specific integrase [Mucilaginibacter sp. L3T2-6]